MRRYFDTSLLVGILSDEVRQIELQDWFLGQVGIGLFVSWWSITEFQSATSKQVRIRPDFVGRLAGLRSSFDEVVARSMTVLPVDRSHFAASVRYVSHPEVNLRSSDALHLAVAAAHGLELVTLDKRMASGGTAVGVATLLL